MAKQYETRKQAKKSMKRKKIAKRTIGLILSFIILIGVAVGYVAYRTNNSFDNIKRGDLLPSSNSATDKKEDSGPHKPLTYLLLGSDSRGKDDSGRSDSIMVAYIPANRKHVYLISLPRDLYVNIPGHDRQKINAAYELGGSKLTVETIDNLLNIDLQHVAMVNFNGFVSLIDTLGGVKINNPYGGCDDSQNICWKKGEINLKSWNALHYVRWRHGLPNGDIDRAQNQQRVLKAIVGKSLSSGTLVNPVKLSDLVDKASKNITVDNSLSNSDMRNTILGLDLSSSSDIRSLTVPVDDYKDVSKYGSVDMINYARLDELKKALATDSLDAYWSKYNKVSPVGATPNEALYNKNEEAQLESTPSTSHTTTTGGE